MRDLFGLLVIALALVWLGVFRVPDENALVTRGILAEAQEAVRDHPHPLTVTVKGARVSVAGPVDSPADRGRVLSLLNDIPGVEAVQDRLVQLPVIAPFWIDMDRGPEGAARGYVPSAGDAAQLAAVLGFDPEPLTVAQGAPDAEWTEVAGRLARALRLLEDGQTRLEDRSGTLRGTALLPGTLDQIDTLLSDLPAGYTVTRDLQALDDGLPYSLHISRDDLMGLRISGKLPPGFDLALFDDLGQAQSQTAQIGPVDLEVPGFEAAARAGLALFAQMPAGALTLGPGTLGLSGGPVPDAMITQAKGLELPPGWRVHLALIPEDDGAPLSLMVDWDGISLTAQGKVPAEFDLTGLDGAVQQSPYPDKSDWGRPVQLALAALRLTDRGQLQVAGQGIALQGWVANPDVAQQVQALAPEGTTLDLVLRDDGTPPRLRLTYAVDRPATIEGKLPNGLTPPRVAVLLGVALVGTPPVAPGGQAADLEQTLRVLGNWLPVTETLELGFEDAQITVSATLTPGAPVARIQQILAVDLRGIAQVQLSGAQVPLTGTQRVNLHSGQPQVYRGGWLPELDFQPTAQSCADATRPDIAFDPGSLRYAPQAVLALNNAAALIHACTRLAGLTARISVAVDSGGSTPLNDQLARRRADSLRAEMLARGVAEQAVIAQGDRITGPDRVQILFD